MDILEQPIQSVQPVETPDGFLVDPETGEIVGLAAFDPFDPAAPAPSLDPEQFHVTDLRSAEWVLQKLQETDSEIARLDALCRARVEALQTKIAGQKKRRDWLLKRFAPELEQFAVKELEGKKGRTLKTGFGSLAFHKSRGRIEVKAESKDAALDWLQSRYPTAIKVSKSILVSELKGHEAQLPDSLFTVVKPVDEFKICTGFLNLRKSEE